MNFRDKYYHQWQAYSNLCDVRKSYEFYGIVFEELYEVDSVVSFFKILPFLDENCLNSAKKFELKWHQLIKEKSYSSDRVFIYLDDNFQKILDNELLQFLVSFNRCLETEGYQDMENLELDTRIFPSTEDILERVGDLYSVIADFVKSKRQH